MKVSTAFLKQTGVTCKEILITALTLLAINAIVILPAVKAIVRHFI